MLLLDMLPEVFERVIAALAAVTPFHELVRLRTVCSELSLSKVFAGYLW
jgi:hypothetical protein